MACTGKRGAAAEVRRDIRRQFGDGAERADVTRRGEAPTRGGQRGFRPAAR